MSTRVLAVLSVQVDDFKAVHLCTTWACLNPEGLVRISALCLGFWHPLHLWQCLVTFLGAETVIQNTKYVPSWIVL